MLFSIQFQISLNRLNTLGNCQCDNQRHIYEPVTDKVAREWEKMPRSKVNKVHGKNNTITD
jgi:hypothetical protein